MLEKMLKYLVAGLALGCSPVDSERLGCISDDDCKGDRECVQGECVTQEKDAYVGVEEVASCSLDKYVCIDDKTVGELDTCGLTSLYSKCLDSEICSSGECVGKPCPEFNGSEFYEGFDGPLDPCKWDFSEGNKGEVIDGYWVTTSSDGSLNAKYNPGCEDFTLTVKMKLTKSQEHRSIGFNYHGLGLTIQQDKHVNDKARISLHCPAGFSKVKGVDLFEFVEYKIEVSDNQVVAYLGNDRVEDLIEGGFLTSFFTAIGDFYPPWICDELETNSFGISGDSAVVDYVELKCGIPQSFCEFEKYVCMDAQTVGSVDNCDVTEVAEQCGSNQVCKDGACVCNFEKTVCLDGNTVVNVDSCGKQYGAVDCEEGKKCMDGSCVSCDVGCEGWDFCDDFNGDKLDTVCRWDVDWDDFELSNGEISNSHGTIVSKKNFSCQNYTVKYRAQLTGEMNTISTLAIDYAGVESEIMFYIQDDNTVNTSLSCNGSYPNVQSSNALHLSYNVIDLVVSTSSASMFVNDIGASEGVCNHSSNENLSIFLGDAKMDYFKFRCD